MQLLKYFYADVRQHQEIAPIFAAQITDWPAHLAKIADFWSGATGGPVLYSELEWPRPSWQQDDVVCTGQVNRPQH